MFRDNQIQAAAPTMREVLDEHLASGEPLVQNIFRYGSEAWCDLLCLARELYRAGELSEVSEEDYVMLESGAGERASYNGVQVLLDVPEVNYEGSTRYLVSTKVDGIVTKLEFDSE